MKAKNLILALLVFSIAGLSLTPIQAQGWLYYEEPVDDNGPVYVDRGGIVGGAIEGAGEVVSDVGRAVGDIL